MTNRDLLVRVLRRRRVPRRPHRHRLPRPPRSALTTRPRAGDAVAHARARRGARGAGRAPGRLAAPGGHPGRLAQRRSADAARGVRGRRRARRRPTGVSSTGLYWSVDASSTSMVSTRTSRCSTRAPSSSTLETDGERRRYSVHRVGDTVYVDSSLGASTLHVVDRFPDARGRGRGRFAARAVAGQRGAASRWSSGQKVAAGDVLVVLEAMKMEHTMRAPYDGVIAELRVAPGTQVETGDVLVVVEPTREASMSVTYEVVRGVAWATIDRAGGVERAERERAHRPLRRGRALQRRRLRARCSCSPAPATARSAPAATSRRWPRPRSGCRRPTSCRISVATSRSRSRRSPR